MADSQKLFMAFACGAVAGGAVAFLMAPEKGEVTRKRLKEGAQGLLKRGQSLAGHIRGAAEEAITTASDNVADGAKAHRR